MGGGISRLVEITAIFRFFPTWQEPQAGPLLDALL